MVQGQDRAEPGPIISSIPALEVRGDSLKAKQHIIDYKSQPITPLGPRGDMWAEPAVTTAAEYNGLSSARQEALNAS